MKTTKEILEWLEDRSERAKVDFKNEPSKNTNLLAAAYLAEVDLCQELTEFIKEPK